MINNKEASLVTKRSRWSGDEALERKPLIGQPPSLQAHEEIAFARGSITHTSIMTAF